MTSDPAYSNDPAATIASCAPRRAIARRPISWLAPVVVLALAGCRRSGVLDPQGPVARAETLILVDATAIMLAVIVPVILATLGFAWWYRRGNAYAKRRPDFTYSGPVEMVVWSIPVLIILFLGGIAWTSSHDLDTARPLKADRPAINVDVVSLDWKWLFIYPDQGIATVNRLVVPAGTPIHLRLTSSGVMNSFLVPQLGSQIYTMAGMTTELNLLADKPGRYPGFSAQFSGAGFSDMRFVVDTVAPDRFAGWATSLKGRGKTLDSPAYRFLARPGQSGTGFYGTVTPRLFDTIVANGTKWPCRSQLSAEAATNGSARGC